MEEENNETTNKRSVSPLILTIIVMVLLVGMAIMLIFGIGTVSGPLGRAYLLGALTPALFLWTYFTIKEVSKYRREKKWELRRTLSEL